MDITPEIGKPQKTFIENFSDSCIKHAQLEMDFRKYQQTGFANSKEAKAIIEQRDDLYDQMIQSASDKLLATHPTKRLDLVEEIKTANNKLLSNSAFGKGMLDGNLFVEKMLLKVIETKEAK